MADSRTTTLLIIDTATSGFREATDTILEVACILVDVSAATLDVLDTHTSLVRQEADLQVPDFHAALLAECSAPDGVGTANSMRAVEGFLLAGQWTTADLVCNRNLDFDMRFLAKHMPTLHKALAKKPAIELKALERMATALGVRQVVAGPRSYRAGDDACAAYEELCHYAAVLRTGVAP